MNGRLRLTLLCLLCALLTGSHVHPAAGQAKPEGEMRLALYVTLAPAWFDPGESVPGVITPFWVLYALHDALVKPMPGNRMAPSLAESWTVSADQRAYEFKLRKGLKFHNGDPFTAEDVKFSFKRAKGGAAAGEGEGGRDRRSAHGALRAARAVAGLHDVLRHARDSAAGWIVPKNYFEKVGADGFKKHPIGLGPYKFVSIKPGHRTGDGGERGLLAQGAVGQAPRLPERAGGDHAAGHAEARRSRCRLPAGRAAGRVGQARSEAEARLLRRHRHLLSRLLRHVGPEIAVGRPARAQGGEPGDRPQGDQRSRDARRLQAERQRRAAELRIRAADRAGSRTIRRRRKKLLAEAGYPNGFDAGDLYPWPPYFATGEAIVGYLGAIGIRTQLRTMERAAFYRRSGDARS